MTDHPLKRRKKMIEDALQLLVNQLPIGVFELRAVLLGHDRVPQGLDQLQPF
ncbi:MAG: hypothetical protein ACKO3F_13145 [Cyanobium sp.]